MLRPASAFLFLLVCATALPRTTDPANPDTLNSFYDYAMHVTYFYPSRFVPQPSPPATAFTSGEPKCVRTTLFANSVTQIDTSSFALSTVDRTCPDVLHRATQLGPFIREQILRQLKQYGEPTITREPTRYNIDGRPAAIILASVPMPAASGMVARSTYAAKACVPNSLPVKSRKKNLQPDKPVSHVFCFDFTTQNNDLLSLMFSFIIQFDNDPLGPMVPGSVLRRR
jgi:hypothetical protein